MKWSVAALVLVAATTAPKSWAGGADLVFPTADGALRLRLEVRIDGQPADTPWEAFLDRWLDYHDRDGDRLLSPSEASRAFAVPVSNGKHAAVDFKQLDRDGDGKGSLAEVKAYFRHAGFGPVVATLALASEEEMRLSAILLRRLDRNGDGKLDRAELNGAAALLRKLDLNEDEVLTAAELLAAPFNGRVTERSGANVDISGTETAHAVVGLNLDKFPLRPTLESQTKSIQHIDAVAPDRFQLRAADSICTLIPTAEDRLGSFEATRSFLRAQFEAAVGSRHAVEKRDLEQDASLQGLVRLFDAADRDANGRLDLAELDALLALIGQGVAGQLSVTVVDRGRNLFDLLDQDHNRQLDLRELNAVARALPSADESAFLTEKNIPGQLHVAIERGAPHLSFGPVPLQKRLKPATANVRPPQQGPAWFRAMDRNGDNLLSAREFIGSPAAFQKLDRDGDRLISTAEAERAEANKSPAK